MGLTSSLSGRQFHRKKGYGDRGQPVGGRYQAQYLKEQQAVQLTPRRSHLEHHFAFHGATPRTADINDRDLQRKWSVDGYLTELDMRDPASAALTSRLIC